MSKLSRLSSLGLAKETVLGTAVVPSVFFSPTSFDTEDIIAPIRDESFRANDSILQGQYGGISSSTVGFSSACYPDTLGHLLRAMGLADTVTGTGPYVHTLKSTNAQPPSYTLTASDPVSNRAFPGCMQPELGLKIDAAGGVTVDSKWMGWPGATAATPTPAFSALQPFLGWQLTWSANAVASTKVLSAEINLKRDVEVIPAADGTQAPRETFAAGLEATFKGKALFEDETDLNRFLTYAQQALVATLTQSGGFGSGILVTTFTKASWEKAKVSRGDKYLTLEFEGSGVYNATDAGPVSFVLTNSSTPAY